MRRIELWGYMGVTAVTALITSLYAGQIATTLLPNLPNIATIWFYAPRLAPLLGLIGTGLALSQNPNSPRNPLFRCLLIGSLVGLIPGLFFTLLHISSPH